MALGSPSKAGDLPSWKRAVLWQLVLVLHVPYLPWFTGPDPVMSQVLLWVIAFYISEWDPCGFHLVSKVLTMNCHKVTSHQKLLWMKTEWWGQAWWWYSQPSISFLLALVHGRGWGQPRGLGDQLGHIRSLFYLLISRSVQCVEDIDCFRWKEVMLFLLLQPNCIRAHEQWDHFIPQISEAPCELTHRLAWHFIF